MTRTSHIAARADGFERRASTAVRVAPAQPTTHAGVVTRVLAACVDLAVVVLVTVLIDLGAAGVRFAWAPDRWGRPHLEWMSGSSAAASAGFEGRPFGGVPHGAR